MYSGESYAWRSDRFVADSAVALALRSLLAEKVPTPTVDLDVKYITPARSDIFAEAKIIHKGSTTAVGDVEIKAEKNRLIAKATAAFAIRKH